MSVDDGAVGGGVGNPEGGSVGEDDVNKNDTNDRLFTCKTKLADKTKEYNYYANLAETLRGTGAEKEEELAALRSYMIASKLKDDLVVEQNRLEKELKTGKYFAKNKEIFPVQNAVLVTHAEFKGKADALLRESCLHFYLEQKTAFVRHLQPGNVSIANGASTTPSEPSETSAASSVSAPAAKSKDRVGEVQDRLHRQDKKKAKEEGKKERTKQAKACIIQGKKGHRAHMGPDGKTCVVWWAPVYLLMVGKIDELERHMINIDSEINEDRKKELKKRLIDALMMLAVGSLGGGKGMKDAYQNILYVPNPHDGFLDAGHNWKIFPIMTLSEILQWDGGQYCVAIWVGERESDDNESYNQNIWKDGKSEETAEEAEKSLFNDFNPDDIKVCSTSDLKKITQTMNDLGLGLADLHTRTNRFNIREMAPAVEAYLKLKRIESIKILMEKAGFKPKSNDESEIESELKDAVEKGPFFTASAAGKILETLEKMKAEEFSRDETGLQQIRDGLSDLDEKLRNRGLFLPRAPTTNHFGAEGRHVFKTTVWQSYPTDPLIVGTKGLNNFLRDWGNRMMPVCRGSPGSRGSSSSSSSSSSVSEYSTPTPTAFVGTEIVVVTPTSLTNQTVVANASNTVSDDDSCISDVSCDDMN